MPPPLKWDSLLRRLEQPLHGHLKDLGESQHLPVTGLPALTLQGGEAGLPDVNPLQLELRQQYFLFYVLLLAKRNHISSNTILISIVPPDSHGGYLHFYLVNRLYGEFPLLLSENQIIMVTR